MTPTDYRTTPAEALRQSLALWLPPDQATELAPMVIGALGHRGYRLVSTQSLQTIRNSGNLAGEILDRANDY